MTIARCSSSVKVLEKNSNKIFVCRLVNYLPVKPTFLRHSVQRFFFFFASLSSSLSLSSSSAGCVEVDGPADAAASLLGLAVFSSFIFSLISLCCKLCTVGCAADGIVMAGLNVGLGCGLGTDTGVLPTGGCCFFLNES